MRAKRNSPPDFLLFLSVMMLLSIGLIMVFSSSYYFAMDPPFNDKFYFFQKQLISAVLGFGALLFFMNFNYRQLKGYVNLILGSAFLFLVLVMFIGDEYLGSQRWLTLGPIPSFQPSEMAKICIIIYTAYGLSLKREQIRDFFQGIGPYLLISGFAAGLILMQPDLGTAATLMGTVTVMFFAAGARIRDLGLLGLAGAGAVVVAIYFAPYRMRRFLAFLDPESDPTGAGWQILNSLMALGSGMLVGTGLGQGKHSKLLYLPERHTDFIFASIGEELGFIGGSVVILLFIMFIWRGFKIAVTAPDAFGSLLAAGLVCGIALQAVINIGVVTSSLPITGITLPLVSYGGTSLVFTMAGVGIILNISRYSMRR
ncbi:MAG: putative lipid II flippase FtsW [Bacillota bacterium]|jgi:cell division protein FtsW